MTKLSVSSDESIRFLEWLDPVGLHNLVAIDPVTKAVEAETFDFCSDKTLALDWVKARNGKANLYFSVNEPRIGARTDSKLRRDEIGQVRAFAVDLDEPPAGYAWGDPVEDYIPSAVVNSGNGLWGFWKLAEKVSADAWGGVEAQNKALAAKFHGDTVATNLDRLARLPGTINIPNEAKRKRGKVEVASRILSTGQITYSANEIAAWCPPQSTAPAPAKADQTPLAELDAPASVARAARWLIADAAEAVEGHNGNATTYAVAARLKDFGVSQNVAFELLLDGWNEQKAAPPWPAAELLGIVRNAYAYGSAAPARNAANLATSEFSDESATSTQAPKRGMALEYIADVHRDLKATSRALIEGWYDRASMVVTYGESSAGKTHVVLDQSVAIATGRPWAGRKTHAGLVVYVAAEGGIGIQDRITAHRKSRPDVDWPNAPFALIRHPIDLMRSAADTKALIDLVKQAEARFDQKCVMVVVDTLSRALAGGDENSSADMGAFVRRCDDIRAATGATLHVIHHAGKNTAKGARGHSLLRAAVDTEIEIENNAILSRKQRDMEAPEDLRFAYKPVVIGQNAAGEDVGSVVLDVWQGTEFEVEMTPGDREVLDAIEDYVAAETQKTQSDPRNKVSKRNKVSVIVTPQILEQMTVRNFSKTTLERAFRHFTEIGVLRKCKRGQYILERTVIPSANRHSEMTENPTEPSFRHHPIGVTDDGRAPGDQSLAAGLK